MRNLSCALAALLLGALSIAHADELWVVAEKSRRIWIVDTVNNTVSPSPIPISDPNGDGTVDPPRAITFAKTIASNGERALVAQGPLITVLDATTHAVTSSCNIGLVIGRPSLQLHGLAASHPRRFVAASGSGTMLRTHLFATGVIATTGDPIGTAVWVALDQNRLVTGTCTSALIVGWGTLGPGFRGASIQPLDLPEGALHQRIWITSIDDAGPPYHLRADLIATANLPAPNFLLARTELRTIPGTLPAPTSLQLSAPLDGTPLIVPWGAVGEIRNLTHELGCTLPGVRPNAVSITGPGVDSYTVLVADEGSNRLLVLDPSDCSTTSFPVGRRPVAITPLRPYDWHSAFVINRDGDSVTRIDRNAALTTIALGGGGSTCAECPVAAGVARLPSCSVSSLTVTRDESALDLAWDGQGCPEGYDVYATCLDDDPDCPLSCDCSAPVAGCICPGLTLGADLAVGASPQRSPAPDDLSLVGLIPSKPGQLPWIKQGSTLNQQIALDLDGSDAEIGLWVGGFEGDEPPPLP